MKMKRTARSAAGGQRRVRPVEHPSTEVDKTNIIDGV